ncbi:trimeric intracellular cation channel family protein [Ostreibacterium oceani]|uniref:Trimeric intracellular cation channel family protein n=1 Tax=Ostreibacterium oceani TaxID=2654998 RepID=A0A6N7EUE2_9GAMM|nr:trimeric intracellular cation channel family protein [Ostreibacterium oceani]MPV86052.1 trimeric intracellular cation channel family protein [Ostreibacterium oceani]
MTIETLITSLDLIGIAACATAGSILAIRKGLDVFGVLLIATVASVGGGTVRDLLLNNHPIFWLVNPTYLIVIFVCALLTLIFYRQIIKIERPLRVFDAIGLSAFTVIGVEVALLNQFTPFIAVIMGVTTASFGGIMRDIICNEIPLVLHKEIYITASLIGAGILLILLHLNIAREIAYPITLSTIFGIRMTAVYHNWGLPRFNKK